MEYKLICFDVDGTLTGGTISVWQKITEGLGLDYTTHQEILDQMKARTISLKEAIDELSTYWQTSSGQVHKDTIQKALKSVQLREDAISTIMELKKKYRIGILSGTPNIFLEIINDQINPDYSNSSSLFLFNDDNIFQKFEYLEDQGKAKLEAFNEILDIYNIAPEEVCMVGNGSNDVEVFRASGLSFALEDTTPNEVKAEADHVIDRLSELLDYLL